MFDLIIGFAYFCLIIILSSASKYFFFFTDVKSFYRSLSNTACDISVMSLLLLSYFMFLEGEYYYSFIIFIIDFIYLYCLISLSESFKIILRSLGLTVVNLLIILMLYVLLFLLDIFYIVEIYEFVLIVFDI